MPLSVLLNDRTAAVAWFKGVGQTVAMPADPRLARLKDLSDGNAWANAWQWYGKRWPSLVPAPNAGNRHAFTEGLPKAGTLATVAHAARGVEICSVSAQGARPITVAAAATANGDAASFPESVVFRNRNGSVAVWTLEAPEG